ncbi:NAD(P)-dependent oxidoreductase [Clostridium chromiireducens]|uniref:NAD(P)-dependent oxidoreductase n=1 Tax=Clostridium chromiireducens TaxID=225345 RepID=A0A399IUG0_9CLOT|nr:NAD(P)-dependent oxidoreductase [Clostridium chromiireducens]RII36654.1 NAD(P)-dependent oxidoreductase [Clostridium chromiireducens]
MKKILVTGAGGYIGKHIVTSLLDMGAHVIATDLYVNNIDSRATIVEADIFSGATDIYKELDCPDVLLHMAWKDGFIHNSNAHMEYLSKHFEFIKNMIDGGLKHLAVMGTMHEIGYHEGAIDENTPTNPISMYGIAKDALRKSTQLLIKDKNVVFQWLRAYYIYGDDKRNNSIFAKIILAEEEDKEFFPFTTGKNKYDFIRVEDLAKQISACVMQDEIGGIINCCSGVPMSLAEKVESFIKENNFRIKLKYGAFPDREYDSPAVWGDNSKIKTILEK